MKQPYFSCNFWPCAPLPWHRGIGAQFSLFLRERLLHVFYIARNVHTWARFFLFVTKVDSWVLSSGADGLYSRNVCHANRHKRNSLLEHNIVIASTQIVAPLLPDVSASAISGRLLISLGSLVTREASGRTHLQEIKEGTFVLHIFWIWNCGNDHI